MADGIRQYLVGLGYQIDRESLGRFQKSLKESHVLVKAFALSVIGMATSVEEAVRRTARTYEQLYYMSQRTGVAVQQLQTFRFSLKQIGMDPDAMTGTLARVSEILRDQPYLAGRAERFAPGISKGLATTEDLLKGLAKEYEKIGTGMANSPNAIYLREFAAMLGFGKEDLRQYAENRKEAEAEQKRLNEWLNSIGLKSGDVAKQAKEFNNEWRFAWAQLTTAFEKFTSDSFPTLTKLVDKFSAWLITDGSVIFNQWADEFEKWISKPENVKKIEDALVAVGKAAVVIGKAILKVIQAFISLSDKIGPLEAIGVSLFVAWAAKAFLVQGAIWAIGLAFSGVGKLLGGGKFAGALALGAIGAAAYAAYSSHIFEEEKKAGGGAKPPAPGSPPEGGRGAPGSSGSEVGGGLSHEPGGYGWRPPGGPPSGGGPGAPRTGPERHSSADEVIRPGGGPRATTVAYGGGDGEDDASTATFRMLGSWLKGEAGFRPLVELADESIRNIVSTMERVARAAEGSGGSGSSSGGDGGGGSGDGGSGDDSVAGEGFYEAVSKSEGTWGHGAKGINYDLWQGYGAHGKASEMTLAQIAEVQKRHGEIPAAGAFQIQRSTLLRHAKTLGMDLNTTKFTPEVQRRLADEIRRVQGYSAWSGLMKNPHLLRQAMAAIAEGGVPAKRTSEFVIEQLGGMRRNPISDKLRGQLDAAGQKTGLEALVTSGGQEPGHGKGYRHNRGGAADLWVLDPKTKERLISTNPAHQKRLAAFITEAVAAGVTGVGAGPGYMSGRLHLGGGPLNVWGASESANTALPWVKDAVNLGLRRRAERARRGADAAPLGGDRPLTSSALGSERRTQMASVAPTLNITMHVNGARKHRGNKEIATGLDEAERIVLRNYQTVV